MGPTLVCAEDFPNSAERWRQLEEAVRTCLPAAVSVAEAGSSLPRQDEHRAQFRIGRTLITIDEAGYFNLPERYVAIHVEVVGKRKWRPRPVDAETGK